ncbi:hypothetical protein NST97_12475 [Aeribacillus sp. FSL K6-1305]|uniref:hypothetical protein n=1 Tax=Aeribacillus sp. FSL K6-1305 TaxID=2954569 RepID=UPI0030FD826E
MICHSVITKYPRAAQLRQRLGSPSDVYGRSNQYSERDVCDQCNRTDDQGDSETFEVDVQFELKS